MTRVAYIISYSKSKRHRANTHWCRQCMREFGPYSLVVHRGTTKAGTHRYCLSCAGRLHVI